jgi:hypothetical protein
LSKNGFTAEPQRTQRNKFYRNFSSNCKESP